MFGSAEKKFQGGIFAGGIRLKEKIINQYALIYNAETLFTNHIFDFMWKLITSKKNHMLIVNNRYERKIARLYGRKSFLYTEAYEKGSQFLALREILLDLNKRNISCYMINRVATLDKSNYSDNAAERMKRKLSFPKMYKEIDKYESIWRELLGDAYSKSYVEQLGKIPQVIERGNIYGHEDCSSEYINVSEGRRIVPDAVNQSAGHIHMFGRCGIFGYAVEDKDTLPNQLQILLNERGHTNYNIINYGLWGGTDSYINHNIILKSSQFQQGDIVIIYMKHFAMKELEEYKKCGLLYYDITEEYHQHEESKWCFYDRAGHMTREGYRIVADIIYKKLAENNFACPKIAFKGNYSKIHTSEYLELKKDNKFTNELKSYFTGIRDKYPIAVEENKIGAIVMNCNPFTNGHRYLIEYASGKVDRLYIFVLEEDKSFFKFEDRFQLVKSGTEDLKNVIVLPSREFIISALTFPEYFMKDYVQEKEIDVTKDLTVFCEYIAPILGISIRFVGEEPIDQVTKRYNENMKKILPQYGLQLLEIPRLEIEGGGVVSASKVRKLMSENKYDEIKNYVPLTTYDFLVKNYKND